MVSSARRRRRGCLRARGWPYSGCPKPVCAGSAVGQRRRLVVPPNRFVSNRAVSSGRPRQALAAKPDTEGRHPMLLQ